MCLLFTEELGFFFYIDVCVHFVFAEMDGRALFIYAIHLTPFVFLHTYLTILLIVEHTLHNVECV